MHKILWSRVPSVNYFGFSDSICKSIQNTKKTLNNIISKINYFDLFFHVIWLLKIDVKINYSFSCRNELWTWCTRIILWTISGSFGWWVRDFQEEPWPALDANTGKHANKFKKDARTATLVRDDTSICQIGLNYRNVNVIKSVIWRAIYCPKTIRRRRT